MEDLFLDVLDRTDGKFASSGGVDEVLTARVNGDAALSDDDVDEFARAGERGDLIDDDGDAISKRRHGKDGASSEEAILPSANAVEEASVGVGDDVTVEVNVNLGGAEDNGVDHRREVSLAVIVVRGER